MPGTLGAPCRGYPRAHAHGYKSAPMVPGSPGALEARCPECGSRVSRLTGALDARHPGATLTSVPGAQGVLRVPGAQARDPQCARVQGARGSRCPQGARNSRCPQGDRDSRCPQGARDSMCPQVARGLMVSPGGPGLKVPSGCTGLKVPQGSRGTRCPHGAWDLNCVQGVC
jgi:hypothetical protein